MFFFVISGYLITTVILREIQLERFSIINFYERRARRILPALFVVLFVSVIFAWFWFLPSQMKKFCESLVSISLFSSNILFYLTSGYFGGESETRPLLHTWSLSLEEHFYAIFPLLILILWKKKGTHFMLF